MGNFDLTTTDDEGDNMSNRQYPRRLVSILIVIAVGCVAVTATRLNLLPSKAGMPASAPFVSSFSVITGYSGGIDGHEVFTLSNADPSVDLAISGSLPNNVINGNSGGPVTASFQISQKGPDTAINAIVKLSVPTNFTFGSVTPSDPAWTCGGLVAGEVTCTRASWPVDLPNTFPTIDMVVNVPAGTPTQSIFSFVGAVSSDTPELQPSDNVTIAGPVVITPGPGGPALQVASAFPTAVIETESFLPANQAVDPGETVTVKLCIGNGNFNTDATTTFGTLRSTNNVTSPVGPLSYGTVQHRVNDSQGPPICKVFTFTGNPAAACGTRLVPSLDVVADPASTSYGTVVFPTMTMGVSDGIGGFTCSAAGPPPSGSVDLSIFASLGNNVVDGNTGGPLNPSFQISQKGPDTAVNAVVNLSVPSNFTFGSVTPSDPAWTCGGLVSGEVTCTRASWPVDPPNTFPTIDMVVNVPPGTPTQSNFTFVGRVSSDTPELQPHDNVSTTGGGITPGPAGPALQDSGAAPVFVSESFSPANNAVDPGETVTVTFCIGNANFNTDATNAFGTLRSTNNVTAPVGPVGFGTVQHRVNNPQGPPVCRNLTFTGNPAAACGTRLVPSLDVVADPASTSYGTVVFPTMTMGVSDGIGGFTCSAAGPPPDVTINQAAGQPDPANGMGITIHFTAVFNEPVTGFTNSDVTIGGTAGATTVVVTEIAPMNGTTYDVAVSGMTMGGTVTASIPAGGAQNAAANSNTASTSTDNTVTYVPNTPPTANPDSYSTGQDTPLTIPAPGVLGNDSDSDAGNTITAVLVSGPTNAASFALNADGSFNYTPTAGFTGTDTFTYKARDNFNADSNTVTVTLSVKFKFSWVSNSGSGYFGTFTEQGLNQVTAGSDVPVRFTLYGNKGNPYSSAPTSQQINCSTQAPIGAATVINRYMPDPFYSSLYDFYQTTWRTQVAWKFTCRRLTLHLNDGTTRSLNFYFK